MKQLHAPPILAVAGWPGRAARLALAVQQALLPALTLLALTLYLICRMHLAIDTGRKTPVDGLMPRPAPLAIAETVPLADEHARLPPAQPQLDPAPVLVPAPRPAMSQPSAATSSALQPAASWSHERASMPTPSSALRRPAAAATPVPQPPAASLPDATAQR
jgi:hypothetical protein